jgi:hypothetical protein
MLALTKWVLLLVIVVTGWSFAQPAADKPPPDKKAENRSLDELIAAALRHSPDLQVADAKVRTAQAELRRDRLVLVQKVIDANAALDAARAAARNAEESFREHAALFKTGAMSSADYRAAEGRFAAAKATLAQAEGTLNALTGTLPAGVKVVNGVSDIVVPVPAAGIAGAPPAGIAGISGIGGVTGNMGGYQGTGIAGFLGTGISGFGGGIGNLGAIGGNLGALGGGLPMAPPVRAPQPPMSDKLRDALDSKMKIVHVKNLPLDELVMQFKIADVPYLLHLGDKAKETVNFTLVGEVQRGAVFQALEDVVPGLKCYVRDYGILVTMEEGSPEGAMPLIEFWHTKPRAKRE